MTHRINITLISVAALIALTLPARADLQICSRMSYVVEAAIAIEDKGAAATRGWFRIDPGQCRTVIQGTPPGETLYLHARALPVYGGSPLPQAGTPTSASAPTPSCCRRRKAATAPGKRSPASPPSSRPRPRRGWSPISPRTPNTTTSRRATPASSGS